MAVAALVLGILALAFFILFFPLGLVLAVLAIVFGFIGRARAKRDPVIGRQGMALAGIILGFVTLLLIVIVAIIIGAAIIGSDESIDEIDEQDIQEQIEELENQ